MSSGSRMCRMGGQSRNRSSKRVEFRGSRFRDSSPELGLGSQVLVSESTMLTRNAEFKTRNSKLETRNAKLETNQSSGLVHPDSRHAYISWSFAHLCAQATLERCGCRIHPRARCLRRATMLASSRSLGAAGICEAPVVRIRKRVQDNVESR